ncbi:MAG: CehA/McbA family metallohydrolase [bacterium]|nr:CehA/McbA family metallohydrolase [bacterium]
MPEGMMRMNTDAYYRMLNCGLRLAAGGGSATGVKSSPVGYNRCYVQARGEASFEEFLDGWRKGRNFVTNGPMVFLSAGDGDQPGDTIEIPAGGRQIAVRATATSAEPLRSLEIVVNGRVADRAKIPPDVREASLDARLDLAESSWIAARATEEDRFLDDAKMEPYVLYSRGRDRPARVRPSRLRFAHTSPIYALVDGRPVRVNESVAEARKMLEAFGRFARKTADEEHRKEILDRVAEARGRL